MYVDDHLAGAAAGRARFARAAKAQRGTRYGEALSRLHDEVAQDRRTLQRIARSLGVQQRRSLQVAARVGEAAGALKPNGRLVRQSPLRLVVELELLTLGVLGKAAGWRTLLEVARTDARLDVHELQELLARAERQAAELEQLRRDAVVEVLVP